MTPPRPTAPTAAEQERDFLDRFAPEPLSVEVFEAALHMEELRKEMGRELTHLRVEALEDAATLAEIYVGLSARAARVPRAIRAMVSK